jgi:hypothetical protein
LPQNKTKVNEKVASWRSRFCARVEQNATKFDPSQALGRTIWSSCPCAASLGCFGFASRALRLAKNATIWSKTHHRRMWEN